MVEVRYVAQLGNKLFQYCLGRIIAEKLGFKLKADPINGFPNTGKNIDGHNWSSYPTQILEGQQVDLQAILEDRTKRKIILEGFFQRYEYYRDYKNIIRNDWLLTDINIPDQIDPNDVVIHVRRGDYLNHGYALPLSYYESALKKIKYNRVFIVTDEPSDPFLSRFKPYNAIIHKGSMLEDFKFIMLFKKIILPESTFSWWAAFLSGAEEICSPVALYGRWFAKQPGPYGRINLKVDDENRYIHVECNERYKITFSDKIMIQKNRIKYETKIWHERIKKHLLLKLPWNKKNVYTNTQG